MHVDGHMSASACASGTGQTVTVLIQGEAHYEGVASGEFGKLRLVKESVALAVHNEAILAAVTANCTCDELPSAVDIFYVLGPQSCAGSPSSCPLLGFLSGVYETQFQTFKIEGSGEDKQLLNGPTSTTASKAYANTTVDSVWSSISTEIGVDHEGDLSGFYTIPCAGDVTHGYSTTCLQVGESDPSDGHTVTESLLRFYGADATCSGGHETMTMNVTQTAFNYGAFVCLVLSWIVVG